MNKKNKPLIIGVSLIVLVIALLVIIMFVIGKSKESVSKFKTSDDLKNMINTIYNELGDTLPALDFQNIDSSTESFKYYTGLSDSTNVEFFVVSEPLMNAQAYSLVVLKVKDTSKIETMKQEMYNNINMAKWLCVSAEKLYITNSDDIIFMVMASDNWATPVYNGFKKFVNNNIGKELTKTEGGNLDFRPVAD
ncbi:MAG: hypothetical protein MSH48_01715 [Mollicutes bacterium]|nr:hypothetical protein [Mollicutes bacterium]